MPWATKKLSTGTKLSCSGIASTPTMARKIQSRNGNFIHANA